MQFAYQTFREWSREMVFLFAFQFVNDARCESFNGRGHGKKYSDLDDGLSVRITEPFIMRKKILGNILEKSANIYEIMDLTTYFIVIKVN